MVESDERIRWAPKVRQAKAWQLHQTDALGIVGQALVDEVGLSLLARCRSVLIVSDGHVGCPRCGLVFPCLTARPTDQSRIGCPAAGCGWETTFGQYHGSWRHQDLIGTRAFAARRTFVERYGSTDSPRARMVLIDQLLHAFHWGIARDTPHRSAANNLFEGSHEQVVAFLDRLT